MVTIGFAMFVMIVIGWIKFRRIDQGRRYLKVLPWFIPLPYIACNCGWIMTEVGRQPWLVYKVMKTSDGLSEGLMTSQVAFSLITLTLLIVFLSILACNLMVRHARKVLGEIVFFSYPFVTLRCLKR
jgi:cytochrome d ubiquinol oxidase subunit I